MDELQEQLQALQNQLRETNEVFKGFKDEEIELNAQEYQLEQAYKAQMKLLAEKQAAAKKAKKAAYLAKQAKQKELQKLLLKKQEAEKAKQDLAVAQMAKSKAGAEWTPQEDWRTAAAIGAPWREWAKDYQLEASHKITENMRVLLADEMGLGKTLEVIAASDMIRKATELASPDFPKFGEEVQHWIPDRLEFTQLGVSVFTSGQWEEDEFLVENASHLVKHNIDGTMTFRGEPIAVGSEIRYPSAQIESYFLENLYALKEDGHYGSEIKGSIKRPVGRRILYICPSALQGNVQEEYQKWSPERLALYIGGYTKFERDWAFENIIKPATDFVIICNYEAWIKDDSLIDMLIACKFDTLIMDEAHTIKNMKTKAFKTIKRIVDESKPAYIIPMTGTPIVNKPQDIFPLLNLLKPEDFYSESTFLVTYCEEYWPDGFDAPSRWKFKDGGLALLSKKISNNFIYRTKADVGIDLPPQTETIHEIEVDEVKYAHQAKARTAMRERATIIIDAAKGQAIQATVKIALLTRMRQIETWPAGIEMRDPVTKEITFRLDVQQSQKLDYAWNLIKEYLDEGQRVVVFSQFNAPLLELQKRAGEHHRPVMLTGSTTDSKRKEIRADWDRKTAPKPPRWNLLLCNFKAGGVGLNLTDATRMVIVDEEWSKAKMDQARGRIDRTGQTQSTHVDIIRMTPTVDQWLAGIIQQKEALVNGFEEIMNDLDIKGAIDSGLI